MAEAGREYGKIVCMEMKSLWESDAFHRVVRRRIWVMSDLQQSDPRIAKFCMETGVGDFLSLGIPVDAICNLGDTTEGGDLAHLAEMADMQVRVLARVDAPIYYVLGNHEFDYHRYVNGPGRLRVPMRERILREPQWHTAESLADWSFSADFGDLALFFLTDHGDVETGRWCTTHCYHQDVPHDRPAPHDHDADAAVVRSQMATLDKPFFTFSHYSFHGGNRDFEGDLQEKLLPLPPTHIAHFYGHSHVGDHYWGRENYLRQVSTINDTATTQFDVASFEGRRGNTIRSAVVEWYGGHDYAVFFRDHLNHRWEKVLTECDGGCVGRKAN